MRRRDGVDVPSKSTVPSWVALDCVGSSSPLKGRAYRRSARTRRAWLAELAEGNVCRVFASKFEPFSLGVGRPTCASGTLGSAPPGAGGSAASRLWKLNIVERELKGHELCSTGCSAAIRRCPTRFPSDSRHAGGCCAHASIVLKTFPGQFIWTNYDSTGKERHLSACLPACPFLPANFCELTSTFLERI